MSFPLTMPFLVRKKRALLCLYSAHGAGAQCVERFRRLIRISLSRHPGGGGGAAKRGSVRASTARRGSLQSARRPSNRPAGGGSAASPALPTAAAPAAVAAAPAAAAAPAQVPAAAAIPDEYQKYFKMLAMHLPRGAVEQKMMAEVRCRSSV